VDIPIAGLSEFGLGGMAVLVVLTARLALRLAKRVESMRTRLDQQEARQNHQQTRTVELSNQLDGHLRTHNRATDPGG